MSTRSANCFYQRVIRFGVLASLSLFFVNTAHARYVSNLALDTSTYSVSLNASENKPLNSSAKEGPISPSNTLIDENGDRAVVIGIRGPISINTLTSLKQALPKVNGDPIPAGLIVLLDSAGGDGVVAMEIGRLLRKANAHTFVTGQCASACILVLASGVVRAAPAYTIGIHRGRITVSDNSGKILKEIDIKNNPAAKRQLESFEKTLPAYFAEMGLPPDLFLAMQAHEYKGVYRLSHQEIIFYGLSGFDSNYLAQRAQLFEELKGSYHMDKDELHRRTLKVATRCAEYDQQHTAFIQCYKNVLKDPYLN